jgi:hypothetical protein
MAGLTNFGESSTIQNLRFLSRRQGAPQLTIYRCAMEVNLVPFFGPASRHPLSRYRFPRFCLSILGPTHHSIFDSWVYTWE